MKSRRIVPGARLRLQCQHCGRRHEWVVPSPPARWEFEVPAYCSKRCQRNRQRAKARQLAVVVCPRLDKKLYPSERHAMAAAAEMSRRYDELFTAYVCVCGGRHIGSIPFRVLSR